MDLDQAFVLPPDFGGRVFGCNSPGAECGDSRMGLNSRAEIVDGYCETSDVCLRKSARSPRTEQGTAKNTHLHPLDGPLADQILLQPLRPPHQSRHVLLVRLPIFIHVLHLLPQPLCAPRQTKCHPVSFWSQWTTARLARPATPALFDVEVETMEVQLARVVIDKAFGATAWTPSGSVFNFRGGEGYAAIFP